MNLPAPIIDKAVQGRRNKRVGKNTEEVIGWRLRSLGILHLQRIETGFRIIRDHRTKRIVGAHALAKVAGDWRGVLQGGRSVLVECKYRPERLTFSDLDAHQVDALNAHHQAGGLSLLAFAWDGGEAVMAWPVAGFQPRSSLTPDAATMLNLVRIA